MKVILNHPMVRIVENEKDHTYELSIHMRDGGWVKQAPYPADQRGVIGALTLALDVLAGKVLLMGVDRTAKALPYETPDMVLLDTPKK
jgi:hypothetical protein